MHRRPDLYTRWSLEMRRKEFFHAGQRVGVAVSGGPDSVLLLHFMKTLAREAGLTLAAVHFNHHLRGAESDGDEALVRDLAASLGLEYLRGEADVGRVARERGGNVEAVARELRYRYFFSPGGPRPAGPRGHRPHRQRPGGNRADAPVARHGDAGLGRDLSRA